MFKFNESTGNYYLKGTEKIKGELLSFDLTPHVTSIIVITILLIILFIIINRKIRKADPLEEPRGILLLTGMFVESIDNFTINLVGEKIKSVSPYIGFLAIYLFSANAIGLLGFTPPTSSISVTLTFGLSTFFLIKYYGLKTGGIGHITGMFKPIFLAPINIIGDIALPFSLSIRLFGNILSGMVIMTLIYTTIGALFQYSVLLTGFTAIVPLMHIYFDMFSGFIQTLVFILISLVYISNATAD